VLIGGFSQSQFFQQVFEAGVSLLRAGATVSISAYEGSLAHQTVALGDLFNSMLPANEQDLSKVMAGSCSLRLYAQADQEKRDQFSQMLTESFRG
jgi:hypothetical protein